MFKAEPPRTGAGYAALASAHLAEGDEARGGEAGAHGLARATLGSTLETGFLERFGKLLTPADHKWRLDRMLMDDPRWSSDRSERVRCGAAHGAAVAGSRAQEGRGAHRGVQPCRQRRRADRRMPAEDKPDWGLAFQRIQSLRRAGKIEEAAKRCWRRRSIAASIVSPDGWWNERRAIVYELLRLGKPKVAYEIAKAAAR